MKIVVVSDSHRDVATLEAIVRKTQADLYLHAGDSAMPEPLLKPFISVRGNCDFFPYDISKVVELDGLRMYITHGHRISETRMIKNAKAKQCHIAISGHTHVPKIEKDNGLYIINPGSVSYPRGNHKKTYIVIEFDSIAALDIKIVEVEPNEPITKD